MLYLEITMARLVVLKEYILPRPEQTGWLWCLSRNFNGIRQDTTSSDQPLIIGVHAFLKGDTWRIQYLANSIPGEDNRDLTEEKADMSF